MYLAGVNVRSELRLELVESDVSKWARREDVCGESLEIASD
jgi:hypothetical protein